MKLLIVDSMHETPDIQAMQELFETQQIYPLQAAPTTQALPQSLSSHKNNLSDVILELIARACNSFYSKECSIYAIYDDRQTSAWHTKHQGINAFALIEISDLQVFLESLNNQYQVFELLEKSDDKLARTLSHFKHLANAANVCQQQKTVLGNVVTQLSAAYKLLDDIYKIEIKNTQNLLATNC